MSKLSAYLLFLSGYPFGFERLPGMVRYALGGNKDLPEIWVDTQEKRKHVQVCMRNTWTMRQLPNA
eukprot:SAG31_NODE_6660_length_1934_cov_2.343324_1_plen_66_part_00